MPSAAPLVWLPSLPAGRRAGRWLAGLAQDAITPIEKPADLVVPTVSLYEVFKRVLQQRDHGAALQVVAVMRQGKVVELTEALAVTQGCR